MDIKKPIALFCVFLTSLLATTLIYKPNIKTPIISKTMSIIKNANQVPPSNTFTILATGDVMLGRYVNAVTVESKNFTLPFENTANFLSSADLTIVNLEGTLVKNCPIIHDQTFKFCGDPRHIEGLKFAGVDIANLANNHSYNFGADGLAQTINFLESAGIKTTGLNKPTIVSVNNTKIAFLGFNQIPPFPSEIGFASEENVKSQVALAKQNADIVIVSFHWGNEYTTTAIDSQITLAHTAIDNGADLIIGHHPHWVQGVEVYKDKLILYSLGNFIFDQDWSQKTSEGLVAKITFKENKMHTYELIPIIIEKNFQPKVAN